MLSRALVWLSRLSSWRHLATMLGILVGVILVEFVFIWWFITWVAAR